MMIQFPKMMTDQRIFITVFYCAVCAARHQLHACVKHISAHFTRLDPPVLDSDDINYNTESGFVSGYLMITAD